MTFDVRVEQPVQVSRDVLAEICDVLISNAIDHGQGAIAVAASRDASNLVLTVTDDGRLERDPAQLFVRHDPHAAGSGVGLALARSLAEGEDGRLVVASPEPTCFRLILPDRGGVASNP
jgi:signal transduction histidine kinase